MQLPVVDVEVPLVGTVVGVVGLYIAWKLFEDREFSGIPAVGFSFPILNWITIVQYIISARKLISEGYKKYPNSVFRIALHDGWLVVATSPDMVEDIRRAPDDALGFQAGQEHMFQLKYTLGQDLLNEPYHMGVLRNTLSRHLGARFDDIRDEITVAFGEEIGTGEGWNAVPSVKTFQRIVSRVTNRLFINVPLCRDTEWLELNLNYAVDVALGALYVKLTPTPLRPFSGALLSKLKAHKKRANELVGPVIEERLRDFTENGGKTTDLPNDLITWLIEAAPEHQRKAHLLTDRVLLVNFASLHSSTNTFLHVLYKVAANPDFVAPLREEAERIVATGGWTKASVAKMRRLDSFIRETQRVHMLDMTSLNRWVFKPFTFSNGITVPANTLLTVAADAIQTDPAHLGEDAAQFNPWRYAEIEDEEEALRAQMVATSSTHLAFGHGRHACPGRFFAASELKMMLAHMVLEYDVRFQDGKGAPVDLEFANNVVPREVQVEFRKRAA
ncbi:unnamed protein product [Peniophora sp. CBMAI 1063]|nr:unnamed protein product [Peniophora sp. CBMAI 1063]